MHPFNPSSVHAIIIFSTFFSIENARPRSILNDMIAEAHAIREDIVDRQMSNTLQARQHQVHPEETVSD